MPVAYQVRPSWSRAWPGVGAGGLGVVLGGFDGGQVAEDDGALLVIGAGRAVQRGGEGFLGLREVPALS